jgi:hypothetical protein
VVIASESRQNGPNAAVQAVASVYPADVVHELQAWRLAREAATRCNRNLLQYAAGLAAVLGISAGGGGMIAVANSLGAARSPAGDAGALGLSMDVVIGWIVFATIFVGLALLILLIVSFKERRAAERKTAEHLEKLIALAPQWFEPRE